jgi:general secretion pathway protein K
MNFRFSNFDRRLSRRGDSRVEPGVPARLDRQARWGHRAPPAARRVDPSPKIRGTVLIIVLITLVFASVALVTFMDKATNDLLVDHRVAINNRLRMEAYSALETTLAVLQDFREAGNGLHSVAEGWGDPLAFAGYTPAEDHTVDVSFEDESGKISLPHADAQTLSRLFQVWQVSQSDADTLADAMMGWMKRDHVYTSAMSPDYEQSAIPYEPPARPLRSYAELAAIDKVRDFFYDTDGRPNDFWRRFVADVSLLNFNQTNINGAPPEVLAALGQFNDQQQQQIVDFRSGTGTLGQQTPNTILDPGQVAAVAGQGGNAQAFGTTITALRIVITVHEGRSEFKLAAVVTSPTGGASVVQETATSQKIQASASSSQTGAARQAAPNASQRNTGASGTNTQPTQNLRYPFKLLEIRENDEIPPAPPPPLENTNL